MYYSQSYTSTYAQLPAEAFITKGKNRLKQNGSEVYLNDKDNFEIELFNPRTVSVLVKIKLNGNYIPGGGLVLRPGQRYHLDRYLDVARKFQYSTYEIDGGDSQAVAATAVNGLVEVEFYDEKVNYHRPILNWNTGTGIVTTTLQNPIVTYSSNTTNIVGHSTATISGTNTLAGGTTSTANYFNTNASGNTTLTSMNLKSSDVTLDSMNLKDSFSEKPNPLRSKSFLSKQSIETGRVEKGGVSDQKFSTTDQEFNSYTSSISIWKIKPLSTKPLETNELVRYCTNCGAKQKPKNKFCPICGTKLD